MLILVSASLFLILLGIRCGIFAGTVSSVETGNDSDFMALNPDAGKIYATNGGNSAHT